jgi:hypothetical protein
MKLQRAVAIAVCIQSRQWWTALPVASGTKRIFCLTPGESAATSAHSVRAVRVGVALRVLPHPQTRVSRMSEFESDVLVTDRRRTRRRQNSERRDEDVKPSDSFLTEERRQVNDRRRQDRRRQIDPTTCERDYSVCEVEFMRAMDDYKRKSGRPFPTWSEVLEVLTSLGYRKVAEPSTMEWKTFGEQDGSLTHG